MLKSDSWLCYRAPSAVLGIQTVFNHMEDMCLNPVLSINLAPETYYVLNGVLPGPPMRGTPHCFVGQLIAEQRRNRFSGCSRNPGMRSQFLIPKWRPLRQKWLLEVFVLEAEPVRLAWNGAQVGAERNQQWTHRNR